MLCCHWSNDGSMFAIGLRSGEIRLFTNTGQPTSTIPPPQRPSTITEEDFLPKEVPEEHDPETQKTIANLIFKHLLEPPVTSIVWHPEYSNRIIASCNYFNFSLRLYVYTFYSTNCQLSWNSSETSELQRIRNKHPRFWLIATHRSFLGCGWADSKLSSTSEV